MELRFLTDNASDFLARNPAVASAIKAQPGEVSVLERSWARARARENGLEFADEIDRVDDGDLTKQDLDVKHKPLNQGTSDEPWDLNVPGQPANKDIQLITDTALLSPFQEQAYVEGENNDRKKEKPLTMSDSDDYDDDEENLIEPNESSDRDTDETEEDSDESQDYPTLEPRRKKARISEETQTTN